jgi:hypothetical protein
MKQQAISIEARTSVATYIGHKYSVLTMDFVIVQRGDRVIRTFLGDDLDLKALFTAVLSDGDVRKSYPDLWEKT